MFFSEHVLVHLNQIKNIILYNIPSDSISNKLFYIIKTKEEEEKKRILYTKQKFSRLLMSIIEILLCSECILISNSLRLEVDRGLRICVSGILVVIRDAVGDTDDRVGLLIF
jgi:hypothetical protein